MTLHQYSRAPVGIGSTIARFALRVICVILVVGPPSYLSHRGYLPRSQTIVATPKRMPPGPLDRVGRQSLDATTRARLTDSFGSLPLRFEANRGQSHAEVDFLARGSGYAVFVTRSEAVVRFRNRDDSAVLRMKLIEANANPRVEAMGETAGTSNYFIGSDSRRWQRNVVSHSGVKYHEVWRGVDLMYHGKQRQLEYDFELAPGADPTQIRLAFAGPRTFEVSEDGALVMQLEDTPIVWKKPVAWQQANEGRREVDCRYKIDSLLQVGFELGDYDTSRPLVIDPLLVYSTPLGGLSSDTGLGIAVDGNGSAYVCGSTASTDFPTQNAFQSGKGGGSGFDAFVVKLTPDGTGMVYSTYLGGARDETATSIAVDSVGNAYVTGETASSDFPTSVGSHKTTLTGVTDVFVTELNQSGSALIYSTYLGGNYVDRAHGITVDSSGHAYLTGMTESADFPTVGPPSVKSGSAFFSSTNGAVSWTPGLGLSSSWVVTLAVHPGNANRIFAAAQTGIFHSSDGGAHWSLAGALPHDSGISSLAVDPQASNTIYAVTPAGIFKSVTGGQNFLLKSGAFLPYVIAIDPVTTTTLYAGTQFGVHKSVDGGETWAAVNTGLSPTPLGTQTPPTRRLVIDPTNPTTIYAGTDSGLFKTTNGGANWTQINNGIHQPVGNVIEHLVMDPAVPSTLYLVESGTRYFVYKTTNGGLNWTLVEPQLFIMIDGRTFLLNPTSLAHANGSLYAGTAIGVLKLNDGATSWSRSSDGLTSQRVTSLVVAGSNPTRICAGVNTGPDAFVAKISPGGSALAFSRYIGGDEQDSGNAIAVSSTGEIWIAGRTASLNFPTVSPLQAELRGSLDAFVSRFNSGGSGPSFSTLLGGSSVDFASAIAIDGIGSAYVTGTTDSTDFPTLNAFENTFGSGTDAFVTKYKFDGSVIEYSTFLGGSSTDRAFGIVVDSVGTATVTGSTDSPDFPLLGAFQTSSGTFPFRNAFITRINATGASLKYSTLLGSGLEDGNGIATDLSGNAYVVGTTGSSNYPLVDPIQPRRGAQDAFVAKLVSAPDLSVKITANPDPVVAGSNLTYSIEVSNIGELDVTGVQLTDQIPAGAALIFTGSSRGSCSGSTTVVCNIGNLASTAKAIVTIIVKAPARDKLVNTATVTGQEPDSVSNNTATVETTVLYSDLRLTMSATHPNATSSGQVAFMARVSNTKGTTANNVELRVNLPFELTFVNCVVDGASCTGTSSLRSVSFSALAPGSSRLVTLIVRVDTTVPGRTLKANGTLSHGGFDPNPQNNEVSASVLIVGSGELFPAKASGRIVFAGDGVNEQPPRPSGLYTINPDGTGEAFLGQPFFTMSVPVWSPDGSKMAFLGYDDSLSGDAIFVMKADGTGVTRVATDPSLVASRICWSPDGALIMYASSDNLRIYLARADGGGSTLLPGSPSWVSDPTWSPDGLRIAYSRYPEIYVMNIDGSGERPLTHQSDSSASCRSPRWSPDGSKLVLECQSNVGHQAKVINADGTGQPRLLDVNDSHAPSFSPDGTKILFAAQRSVYTINYDGTGLMKLTSIPADQPEWQPIPLNVRLPPRSPAPERQPGPSRP